jgi:proteasome accessory factor A
MGLPEDGPQIPGFTMGEWGRRFLPANGASVYIDSHHLELNTPETLRATDYVAAWHAMLRIADQARRKAVASLGSGQSLEVMANCTDRQGNSFGNHTSVAITKAAWKNLFERKVHHLLWLASYQVSSILFTGAGKVGSENGAPPAQFQLSERADFFGQLTSLETTIPNRGIVNSRDESLAGAKDNHARLHCIFYDTNLCHTAMFLRAAVLQIILSMLEAEEIEPTLILDDPIRALQVISRDLMFRAKLQTSAKQTVTAIDLQSMFLERAARFVDQGRCDGIVPEARQAIKLWADTLEKLRTNDLAVLARRLDWALKLSILSRTMAKRRELNWDSPEIRYADLQYANIDAARGLYWAYERAGLVDRLATDERIAHLQANPPEDTRAWGRAMLLRRAAPNTVSAVDWDSISFQIRENHGRNFWSYTRRLAMDDALGFTKETVEKAFQQKLTLEEILNELERRSPTQYFSLPMALR